MSFESASCAVVLPSEEKLRELEERIRRRLASRVRGFRLAIGGNGLILKGQSRTYYAKQLAQHAVMNSIAVAIDANRIEVDDPWKKTDA